MDITQVLAPEKKRITGTVYINYNLPTCPNENVLADLPGEQL